MRLLVISHTPHYLREQRIVGWGPTVREIDYLAEAFGEVVHLAPLHTEEAPHSAMPYKSRRVKLLPVPPAGGTRVRDKLAVIVRLPLYTFTILREVRRADVVQVRCPCNLGLLACLLLAVKHRPPRWAKYAGNWSPSGREAWSYTIQRLWLQKGWHGGLVTVNGNWRGQPGHVLSFLNPCLSTEEIVIAEQHTKAKGLGQPLTLLFVGRIEREKGVYRCLEIVRALREEDRQVKLAMHFVGDGPDLEGLRNCAIEWDVSDCVCFHGWMSREEIRSLYIGSHILLLPSTASEGWPKVLSEAMAYRVVPLAGAISSIPQVMASLGAGVALPPNDVGAFATTILKFNSEPESWEELATRGQQAAQLFTYDRYIVELDQMFRRHWGSSPIGKISASFPSLDKNITAESPSS